jgi:hypothetical protein
MCRQQRRKPRKARDVLSQQVLPGFDLKTAHNQAIGALSVFVEIMRGSPHDGEPIRSTPQFWRVSSPDCGRVLAGPVPTLSAL